MRLALAGDTMLGRGVAEVLSKRPVPPLFDREVIAAAGEADLFVLNLECCISERGSQWPAPGKPFFFRAPPNAVDVLGDLGVGCVTLANNHALDYGAEALLDTHEHLAAAGIAVVGAGADLAEARRSVDLQAGDSTVTVVAFSDHPEDFAAGESSPGVALADLGHLGWVVDAVEAAAGDIVVVSPHWGPNMRDEPLDEVRRAADRLVAAGADLVAGHSAHVFQGAKPPVLFDLGDFIDDYAVDPVLRNDLGLLFLVTFERSKPIRIEALPLKLDFCYTRLAEGDDLRWIERRFELACTRLGSEVTIEDGRLVVPVAN